MNSVCFFLPDVIIVSVVMAILLGVAVVVILALLAVILRQKRQIQVLTVASSLYVSPHPTYENIADITGGQKIEVTGNVAYGQVKKWTVHIFLSVLFYFYRFVYVGLCINS